MCGLKKHAFRQRYYTSQGPTLPSPPGSCRCSHVETHLTSPNLGVPNPLRAPLAPCHAPSSSNPPPPQSFVSASICLARVWRAQGKQGKPCVIVVAVVVGLCSDGLTGRQKTALAARQCLSCALPCGRRRAFVLSFPLTKSPSSTNNPVFSLPRHLGFSPTLRYPVHVRSRNRLASFYFLFSPSFSLSLSSCRVFVCLVQCVPCGGAEKGGGRGVKK